MATPDLGIESSALFGNKNREKNCHFVGKINKKKQDNTKISNLKMLLRENISNRHFIVKSDKEPIGNTFGHIVNIPSKFQDTLSAVSIWEQINVCSTYARKKTQTIKKNGLFFIFLQNDQALWKIPTSRT